MTVLPFRSSADQASSAPGTGPPATTTDVVGTFQAPSGGLGLFTGTYRLERLLDEHGQLAAAGVFTGTLHDAAGDPVGTGSRRLTCAAVVSADATVYEVRLGPVDVNLLGLMVAVDEFGVAMRRELAPPVGAASRARAARPRTSSTT